MQTHMLVIDDIMLKILILRELGLYKDSFLGYLLIGQSNTGDLLGEYMMEHITRTSRIVVSNNAVL